MNLFTRRILPKVPLAITASFPLLDPKELKSLGERPLLARYLAADLIGCLTGRSAVMPEKKGGCLTVC